MSDLDLKLLGGKFLNDEFPPELSFLSKYFRTELPRMFVIYYLVFGNLLAAHNAKFLLDNFIDHTGFYCSKQRLRYLLKKLQCLLDATQEARLNLDLEMLELIKSGKYKHCLSS